MAISRVGSAVIESDSIAIPTHQVGDLILMFVYRIGSTLSPTIPSGWNMLTGPTGGSGTNRAIFCKWAQSTSETSGAWTNATFLHCQVYRSDAGLVIPGGMGSAISTASSSLAFGVINLRDSTGPTWVAASAVINQTDTDIETPPTGLTFITGLVGTAGEIAAYDTDGGVTSFPATSRTLSGTAGTTVRLHAELQELPYAVSGGTSRPSSPFFQQVIG
jgi:hypothetical protein